MTQNQQDVSTTTKPKLGERFEEAFTFGFRAHRLQVRKSTEDVPYLAHLFGVVALVLEAGGDEELAIAALLHDAAEDQGGKAMLEEIERRFGLRVANVVRGCSDTFDLPKPPWLERKRAYIAHIRDAADADVCLVSAADKVHNARSILTDHYRIGDIVFDRFKATKQQTLWYYREIVRAFMDAEQRIREQSGVENCGLTRVEGELQRVVFELLKRAEGDEQCRA